MTHPRDVPREDRADPRPGTPKPPLLRWPDASVEDARTIAGLLGYRDHIRERPLDNSMADSELLDRAARRIVDLLERLESLERGAKAWKPMVRALEARVVELEKVAKHAPFTE